MLTHHISILERAFKRHISLADESMVTLLPTVGKGADIILDAAQNGNQILLCGNGGSAADCQHFAAELVGRYKKERPPIKAVALTTDTSIITAIGNDYGFEEIFRRQVEALGFANDVLVVFTTSGSSKNILTAIKQAKTQCMKTILLTGEKGKALAKKVDVAIVIPSLETARIQEIHQLVYHSWCEYIDMCIHK